MKKTHARALKLRILFLVAFVTAVGGGLIRAQAPEPYFHDLRLPDGDEALLVILTNPTLKGCQAVAQDSGRELYDCSEYTLQLDFTHENRTDLVSFSLARKSGASFVLEQYGLTATHLYSTGDGIWSNNHVPVPGAVLTRLDEGFEEETRANFGVPFVSVVDVQSNNRLAVGLVRQDRHVKLAGRLSDDKKIYSLSLLAEEQVGAQQYRDTFYLSRAQEHWFRAAQAYTSVVDRSRDYVPLPIPETAYNPTYDSWYWTYDDINQDLVWSLALRARQLGFKSYMLDAGWETAPGQYAQWIEGATGNYLPPAETFPDFNGLLDKMRNQLGLRVMLWMQQYVMGRQSLYYPQVADAMTYIVAAAKGEIEEHPGLCPRSLGTRLHMQDLFARIMDDYRPDGLWFDWQENLAPECQALHRHEQPNFGDAYGATQRLIVDEVRQRNPNTFMELRWPFANLYNKPYAQLWQPIDCPNDFETMRLQAMNLRAFGSGIVIGTDEMYWDPALSDTEVARFMAAVVFTGVPYFGPNLLHESDLRQDMLKAWVSFYEANRADLISGVFSPYGDREHPDHVIESARTTFVYYGNRSDRALSLRQAADRIVLVNASMVGGIDLGFAGLKGGKYRAEISDLLLRTARTQPLSLSPTGRLKLDVPVGCIVTLTRTP